MPILQEIIGILQGSGHISLEKFVQARNIFEFQICEKSIQKTRAIEIARDIDT